MRPPARPSVRLAQRAPHEGARACLCEDARREKLAAPGGAAAAPCSPGGGKLPGGRAGRSGGIFCAETDTGRRGPRCRAVRVRVSLSWCGEMHTCCCCCDQTDTSSRVSPPLDGHLLFFFSCFVLLDGDCLALALTLVLTHILTLILVLALALTLTLALNHILLTLTLHTSLPSPPPFLWPCRKKSVRGVRVRRRGPPRQCSPARHSASSSHAHTRAASRPPLLSPRGPCATTGRRRLSRHGASCSEPLAPGGRRHSSAVPSSCVAVGLRRPATLVAPRISCAAIHIYLYI